MCRSSLSLNEWAFFGRGGGSGMTSVSGLRHPDDHCGKQDASLGGPLS